MNLSDKVIVVTGAGSGIGRELSLQLLQRGARVAGVDLNGDSLQETRALATKDSSGVAVMRWNCQSINTVGYNLSLDLTNLGRTNVQMTGNELMDL